MTGVTELTRIPPFPPVAARLLRLLADDAGSLDDISSTIQGDPALAADILQRANSPLLGLAQRIDTIRHAITLLGLDRVKKMATTVLTGSYANQAHKTEEFLRCWRHTLATALLTEEIAWACCQSEDRAYIAGLLHDIGRIGLLVANPEEYAGILRRPPTNIVDVLDSERARFGLDHCECGRQLAEMWNLPQEFIIVAGRHHDSVEKPEFDLLTLVHLGCQLADGLGYWVVEPVRLPQVEEIKARLPEAARVRFCPDLLALKAALEQELEAYGGGLQIPVIPAPALDSEPPAKPASAPKPEPTPMAAAPANLPSALPRESPPGEPSLAAAVATATRGFPSNAVLLYLLCAVIAAVLTIVLSFR